MLSDALDNFLIWIAIAAVSPLLGYRVGKIPNFRLRTVLLLLLLVAPLLLLTAILLATRWSPPGFVAWWILGVFVITPETIAWCVLSLGGFLWSRTKFR